MKETMDSAIKLVVMKNNPTTAQEAKKTSNVEEFEDWEMFDDYIEAPNAFTEMMHKMWEACSRRLIDALLILAAVLLGATLIMKQPVLGAITLAVAVMAMGIAMFRIVRPAKEEK